MTFFFKVFLLRSYNTILLIYEWENFIIYVSIFMPLGLKTSAIWKIIMTIHRYCVPNSHQLSAPSKQCVAPYVNRSWKTLGSMDSMETFYLIWLCSKLVLKVLAGVPILASGFLSCFLGINFYLEFCTSLLVFYFVCSQGANDYCLQLIL